MHVDPEVNNYTCPDGITIDHGNYTWTNATYNEGKVVTVLSLYTVIKSNLSMFGINIPV